MHLQSDYLRKISLKMLSMESQQKTNTQENPQSGQVVQNPQVVQNHQVVQNQRLCYLGIMKQIRTIYLAILLDSYLSWFLHYLNSCSKVVNYFWLDVLLIIDHMHFMVICLSRYFRILENEVSIYCVELLWKWFSIWTLKQSDI